MMDERKKALRSLKTAKGQIEGIIQMIEDDRYCIDISNQILASTALLKSAHLHILTGHLHTCVLSAMSDHEQADKKLTEIQLVLQKILK
ncbi:MAG: metal-sensing transcriptional repressor [Erysipelotrichaceae bacterium]|nr:metal-sensing transcriptional repressor [Erysipelotrichaceae bacterium]